MKIKRLKRANKHLGYYVNNFGFRQPYQVLIDGTFCLAALKNKFNITEQLLKYLQGEVKLLTTKCAILETEALGQPVQGAMIILKKFPVHRCSHDVVTVSGAACFTSMVAGANTSRYIIATQDRKLQQAVRAMVAVPLLYLHQVSPTLDPPSAASLEHVKKRIAERLALSSHEEGTLREMKARSGLLPAATPAAKKRKRKGGPNPLSCKKKKKKSKSQGNAQKRKPKADDAPARKRVKLAAHVKELLQK